MANKKITDLMSGTPVRDSLLESAIDISGTMDSRKVKAGAVADLANANVASPYDDTVTYAIGQYCLYEGDIYRCIAITTGAFDATKWTQIVVTGEFRRVVELTSAQYAQLTPAEQNNGTIYVKTDEETTADDIPYSAGVSVADKLDNVPTFDTLTTSDNNKLLGVIVSGDDISVEAVDKHDVSTGSITAATGATVRSAYVKKIDGIVYARFAINVTNTFSSRTTIGNFASGFRPSATVPFVVPASTGINDLANRSVSCLIGGNGDIIVGDYCSSSGVKEVSAFIIFPVTVS